MVFQSSVTKTTETLWQMKLSHAHYCMYVYRYYVEYSDDELNANKSDYNQHTDGSKVDWKRIFRKIIFQVKSFIR